ncbi:hypothetical protein [Pararhodobacter sp.]|uniref:hypothetical protein n=1 Tax=Pararhodobacter sp. TaxID=2127056 RepID=UPI002FDD75B8
MGRLSSSTSPLALFANGEMGVWFAPSSETCFADLEGTTPASAGQAVALLLDKSRGLVLGPELYPTGTAAQNTPSFWSSNVNAAVVGNTVSLSGSGAFGLRVGNIPENCVVLIRVSTQNATVSVRTGGGAGVDISGNLSSGQVFKYIRSVGVANTLYIRAVETASGGSYTLEEFSIRNLSGYHTTQPTAAARPILGREPKSGRRNILTLTESMDQWNGLSGEVIVAPSLETSPEGKAFLVTGTSGGSSGLGRLIDVFGVAARNLSEPGVVKFWAKRVSGARQPEYLSGGNRTSYPELPDDGQWHYISAPVASGQFQFLTRWTNSEILVAAPQLEFGSVATPYQRVGSIYDVTEAGQPDCWYLWFDGIDDHMLMPVAFNPAVGSPWNIFAVINKGPGATGNARFIMSGSGASDNRGVRVSMEDFSTIAPRWYTPGTFIKARINGLPVANSEPYNESRTNVFYMQHSFPQTAAFSYVLMGSRVANGGAVTGVGIGRLYSMVIAPGDITTKLISDIEKSLASTAGVIQ